MKIPGSNLLKAASRLIAFQVVTYYKFDSRQNNEIGVLETIYDAPISIKGSFQPIPKNLYEQYDLDLSKNYATFYAPNDILDIQREVSGDYIVYAGKPYQCESNNDWFPQDGWKGVLVIQVPTLPTMTFKK